MSKKIVLLPKMAANNIRKNGSSYFPYIGVSIFAMFTYFVFDLILNNDVMKTLPRAMYAMVLIELGFVLLGIIMVPFLYYTNSFLIKRRKRELGLYSILGLEKKHIGMMMLLESLGIYVIVMTASILVGLIFSKLIFLCLINLSGLPVDISFSISPKAILDSLLFYAAISLLNLAMNLFQVGKANPVELMSDSKKGEKEPRHIGLWSVVGLIFLGAGYYLATTAKMDSMIFMDFFLAVFCVIIGTYFLFTSGSIALLRALKRSKNHYYKADNFITISGMLYRMKKSAASLSNICVFGTMVIVTAVCTISLYLGMDSITSFVYPKNVVIRFDGESVTDQAALYEQIQKAADKTGGVISDYLQYEYCQISITKDGNLFRKSTDEDHYSDRYAVQMLTLEEYNRLEDAQETLDASQVLLYCTGEDFGDSTVFFQEEEFGVKEELMNLSIEKKEKNNLYNAAYIVVFADEEVINAVASQYGGNTSLNSTLYCGLNMIGEKEETDALYESIYEFASGQPGFLQCLDLRGDREELQSMYGGLLFIGIFFGLIFVICLLVIMYYKQITEGYEDQKNFEIMQKVGMSDEEIRHTIKKQIMLVFALPLVGAVCHTIIAMKMVVLLMSAIWMFKTGVIISCAAVVCLVFALLYSLCYKRTAGTYYRIVKMMNVVK